MQYIGMDWLPRMCEGILTVSRQVPSRFLRLATRLGWAAQESISQVPSSGELQAGHWRDFKSLCCGGTSGLAAPDFSVIKGRRRYCWVIQEGFFLSVHQDVNCVLHKIPAKS